MLFERARALCHRARERLATIKAWCTQRDRRREEAQQRWWCQQTSAPQHAFHLDTLEPRLLLSSQSLPIAASISLLDGTLTYQTIES